MRIPVALVFCLAGLSSALAEEPKWSSWASDPLPANTLPAGVVAPDGQLTLYADFSAARGGHIPLYLVNRMASDFVFGRQDGDLYVKLETRQAGGTWRRAQEHWYSYCGDSYMMPLSLPPGRYVRWLGVYPDSGEPQPVRYATYGRFRPARAPGAPGTKERPLEWPRLVSNEGTGRVPADAVAKARHDLMAIRSGSIEFLRDVALGNIELPPTPELGGENPREEALRALEERSPEAVVPIFAALLNNPKTPARIYETALWSLRRSRPDDATALVNPILREAGHARRQTAIEVCHRWGEAQLVDDLAAVAREFGTLAGRLALQGLAFCRAPEARARLEALMNSPQAPEETRLRAQALLETYYQEALAACCEPVGEARAGGGPALVKVFVANITKEPIRFRRGDMTFELICAPSPGEDFDVYALRHATAWPEASNPRDEELVIPSGPRVLLFETDLSRHITLKPGSWGVAVRCFVPSLMRAPSRTGGYALLRVR